MSTDRDKALAKIRKLLRLGKDGRGNVTEAETALRQAQALMRRFDIDEAEAAAKEIRNDPEAIGRAWKKAGYGVRAKLTKIPQWAGVLAIGIGWLYECRVAVADSPQGKVIMFGGYRVDLQVAEWTYDYLVQCVRRSCDKFDAAITKPDIPALQALGLDPRVAFFMLNMSAKKRKEQFRQGMCDTLQTRMKAMAEERKKAQQGSSAGSALVVAKEAALNARFGVQQYADKKEVAQPKAKEDLTQEELAANIAARWARHAGVKAADKVNLTPQPLGDSGGNGAPVAPLLGRS